MRLKARNRSFEFPRPALVMGILNITPDSFYDGGIFFDRSRAVARALELIQLGADIVDIGGESTRPRATAVSEREELARVIPVIEEVMTQSPSAFLSIDTQKPAVARLAVEAGACMINDIAANREHPEMWEVAAES